MKRSISAVGRALHVPLFVTLLAAGCSRFVTAPEPLDGGLVFSVQELHDLSYSRVGEPSVAIFVETEREYPSVSYALRASVRRVGNEIRVSVAGVRPCEICLGMVGPAPVKELLPLGVGEYPLTFTYGGLTDHYLLSVTEGAIEVRTIAAGFTRPRFERFWRFPPNSFAYLCDASAAPKACGEFREVLRSNLALAPLDFSAGGEIPFPTGQTGPGIDWRAEYYRYDGPAAYERAGELLREFIAARPAARLYLMNWRNEQYRSWLGGF